MNTTLSMQSAGSPTTTQQYKQRRMASSSVVRDYTIKCTSPRKKSESDRQGVFVIDMFQLDGDHEFRLTGVRHFDCPVPPLIAGCPTGNASYKNEKRPRCEADVCFVDTNNKKLKNVRLMPTYFSIESLKSSLTSNRVIPQSQSEHITNYPFHCSQQSLLENGKEKAALPATQKRPVR